MVEMVHVVFVKTRNTLHGDEKNGDDMANSKTLYFAGVYEYGNKEQLLRAKPFFEEDVRNNELGKFVHFNNNIKRRERSEFKPLENIDPQLLNFGIQNLVPRNQ